MVSRGGEFFLYMKPWLDKGSGKRGLPSDDREQALRHRPGAVELAGAQARAQKPGPALPHGLFGEQKMPCTSKKRVAPR